MKLNTAIHYAVTSLFLIVNGVCIFTPEVLFLKQVTAYTMFIMLGFLGIGFLAFVFNQQRHMMISLLCCGVLCLYLKESSNKQMRLAEVTSSPSIRITHISLGNSEGDYDAMIKYLLGIDADFLSFQELTPDWNEHLLAGLSPKFNYVQTMTRLDQYGMGFFSKLPFQSLDTIYFNEIPNLATSVRMNGKEICNIISCQVVPPVNQSAFVSIGQHFNAVTEYMKSLKGPVMVLGDFHLPPWSEEVQKFKTTAKLLDGRRDIHPRNIDGSMSLPRIPVEHILYTDLFDCTFFSVIVNPIVVRIEIS